MRREISIEAEMEPVFTLSDSQPSPTFCESLYACSSHGFSSLQSPSAFPSFSSDDSSQQIEASRLDLAELCPSRFHQCKCEDVKQDEFASQSSLMQTSVASHEDFIQDGSFFRDSVTSSMWPHNTHISPFLSGHASLPASAGESHSWLHVLSPDLAQHSSLFTCDSCGVFSEDGYASQTPIFNSCDFQAHETHAQFNSTPQHARQAHKTNAQIDQTSQIDTHDICGPHFDSSKLGPSVLKSSKQVVSIGNNMNSKDAGSSQSESRMSSVQVLGSLVPSPSAFSRFESSKKTKKEPLQEIHKQENVALPAIKEAITSSKPPLKALKENMAPQSFKQELLEGGNLKAATAGWMCPRDAKKNFKPKPRQVLLEKWLIKQR